ncbi:hypothetical protein K470DRAFT_208579 [Piedraia hortae CBS 480.64]|uniref:UDP-N-acetylglucosamine--dolichyl-phosphate N-acetylglucosaminephosphotransferase n=1 Tax=Piedraia hortae CBS 480.64 TaxID=1314780 RepID=A0A6A7CBA4_9PEZI|nr:hypothetical protein K470DRAFT_208579 [Piedraia hortae CBS 480.64]
MQTLSRSEAYYLTGLSVISLAILYQAWHHDEEPLYASLAISGLVFAFTSALIRWTGPVFLNRGYKGRDLAKKNAVVIPETMGLVVALVYLLALIFFLPFAFKNHMREGASTYDVETGRFLYRFPLEKLASYGFAYGTLASMTILGILDDSFDMRWRHKFFIPAFAVLPTLALYYVDFGVTRVVVPLPLRGLLGDLIDLGGFYYIYMAAVAIFCPNCINILAGINGIEVGQCIVVALLICLNDMLYLLPTVTQPHPAAESHRFSLSLLLPLIGGSLALLRPNWYPARVFVGDTYCYFAGMVLAVVGILGHFSKTLLLLLMPQIFNFIYSAPQLFGLVPCPRHRTPRFNPRSNLLEPSMAHLEGRWAVAKLMKWLSRLRLLCVTVNEQGQVIMISNLTLLNLWLVWRGPMREDRLATEILVAQAAIGLLALWARHYLAALLFTADNRF